MTEFVLILNRVFPIIFMLGLGWWIKRSAFLPESTMNDFKKLVVNVSLPAVLFLSFIDLTLQVSFIVVFVMVFLLCAALFALGFGLKRIQNSPHPYYPYLFTGFEYGMLGVSLFGAAYGLENIGYIAVIALGHEIFIWFVFLAFLLMARDGLQKPSQLAGAFLSAPPIIGIFAGIVFNLLGWRDALYNGIVLGGVMQALGFLSNLTIPLILMIVGYGINLNWGGLRDSLPVLVVRLGILIPLAFVLDRVVLIGWLGLDAMFGVGLFTMLILPPPFIIPLYMRDDMHEERQYINNILMLYSLVTIVIFVTYFMLTSG